MMDWVVGFWNFLKENAETLGVVGTLLAGLVAVYRQFFGKPEIAVLMPPVAAPAEPEEIASQEMNVSPIHNLAMLRKVYAFDEKMYKFHLDQADGGKKTIDVENVSFELFESWWRAFPTGFLIASSQGTPVAVVGIFPVTVEWADRFLAREVDEHDLTPEVIRNASGKVYYVSGISTTIKAQGLSKHLPRFMLPAIFEWVRVHIEKFGHEEIRVVSEGSSEQGQDLLERLRFTLETPSTSDQERPRYNKVTTITKVKIFLMESPWMRLCPTLQVQAKSTFS